LNPFKQIVTVLSKPAEIARASFAGIRRRAAPVDAIMAERSGSTARSLYGQSNHQTGKNRPCRLRSKLSEFRHALPTGAAISVVAIGLDGSAGH